ncbi:MAG: transporter [Frankiales bacterium]|nr:transporter [Frankiales bacterium]
MTRCQTEGAPEVAAPQRGAGAGVNLLVNVLTLLVVLDYADRSALGAVAPALRADLDLSLAQLGYVGAVFGVVGGLATLLAGALVDTVPRLRMLALSALTWSVAMLATGLANSLLMLLLARACLGVVLATVGPAYPSLIGDAVPQGQRGRALGRVGAGQLLGLGLGIGVGALAVAVLDWRWAFFALGVPALLLAPRLATVPEPARRGSGDPVPFRRVVRLVRTTPTYGLVLLAVAAGSYYLAGASAFSTLFAVARYDVSTPVADLALVALGAGALWGIVVGSRLSDRLSAQGRGAHRLTWTAGGYLLTAVAWMPALFVHSLPLALPFLVLGSAALGSTIPSLDAIRLDVVPPSMRGRAEAVRTLVRAIAEGGAPLAFGLIASHAGGDDEGLQLAFLLALPGLVVAAGLVLVARRTHDRDRAPVAALEG